MVKEIQIQSPPNVAGEAQASNSCGRSCSGPRCRTCKRCRSCKSCRGCRSCKRCSR